MKKKGKKNKIKKDNFGENYKKNHAEKHCRNQRCLKEKKLQNKILNQLHIKKKSTNIILKNKEIK